MAKVKQQSKYKALPAPSFGRLSRSSKAVRNPSISPDASPVRGINIAATRSSVQDVSIRPSLSPVSSLTDISPIKFLVQEEKGNESGNDSSGSDGSGNDRSGSDGSGSDDSGNESADDMSSPTASVLMKSGRKAKIQMFGDIPADLGSPAKIGNARSRATKSADNSASNVNKNSLEDKDKSIIPEPKPRRASSRLRKLNGEPQAKEQMEFYEDHHAPLPFIKREEPSNKSRPAATPKLPLLLKKATARSSVAPPALTPKQSTKKPFFPVIENESPKGNFAKKGKGKKRPHKDVEQMSKEPTRNSRRRKVQADPSSDSDQDVLVYPNQDNSNPFLDTAADNAPDHQMEDDEHEQGGSSTTLSFAKNAVASTSSTAKTSKQTNKLIRPKPKQLQDLHPNVKKIFKIRLQHRALRLFYLQLAQLKWIPEPYPSMRPGQLIPYIMARGLSAHDYNVVRYGKVMKGLDDLEQTALTRIMSFEGYKQYLNITRASPFLVRGGSSLDVWLFQQGPLANTPAVMVAPSVVYRSELSQGSGQNGERTRKLQVKLLAQDFEYASAFICTVMGDSPVCCPIYGSTLTLQTKKESNTEGKDGNTQPSSYTSFIDIVAIENLGLFGKAKNNPNTPARQTPYILYHQDVPIYDGRPDPSTGYEGFRPTESSWSKLSSMPRYEGEIPIGSLVIPGFTISGPWTKQNPPHRTAHFYLVFAIVLAEHDGRTYSTDAASNVEADYSDADAN
ncbi:hypothetical protein VNI00_013371 [Paramarasmius palmivorus]|uniref:Uncharacterized protein n=1 Tax=Paramarasmius palmivorus TaxID=297713 RepID=A0AAW0BZ89_9AGAR